MDFDIVVVGGGVVGLTTALALADAGYYCVIVSPSAEVVTPGGQFDLRTYALTPASLNVFARLGVTAEIDSSRLAPIKSMYVWDANSAGSITFSPTLLAATNLGVIIEHANLQRALTNRLESERRCERVSGYVAGIDNHDNSVSVRLEDGSRVDAKLVACADGARSPARSALGIEVSEFDYQQQAIVCNVETTEPHEFIARQVFLNTGPLAFLPMPAMYTSSIVWSVSNERAEQILTSSRSLFEFELGAAFEHRLGAVQLISDRLSFPLRRLHSERYVAQRAALLGDSAHVIHPLAGQGLNLGIMDAAALSESLGPAGNETLSRPRARLRRYERWRRADNQLMMTMTNQLNGLFRNRFGAVSWLRGAGLNLTDRLTPLKRALTGHAMGVAGEVPALAKPL